MSQERLEPVPDNIGTPNIPYRGNMDHGVPYTEPEHEDEAHYHTGRPVEYTDAEKEPEPIPVRVVQSRGAREIRTFHTARIFLAAGTPAYRLVGRDERRTVVRIRNTGIESFVIGDMNVTPLSGYRVDAGGGSPELHMTTTEPIWAIADDPSNDVTISLLVETVEQVR